MHALGTLIHFSKQNDLVVKHDSPLKLGEGVKLFRKDVFTKEGKKVGRIKEIYGPVSAPYFSVKKSLLLKGESLGHLKDEVLYING